MTTAARSTKAAELDAIIEALHAELDACPNRLWDGKSNQFRLDLLIEYVAKRDALDAETETETYNGETTMEAPRIEHSGHAVYAVITEDGPAIYATFDDAMEAVKAEAVEVHDGDAEYYAGNVWHPVNLDYLDGLGLLD